MTRFTHPGYACLKTLLVLAAAAILLTSCAALPRRALPEKYEDMAQVDGLQSVRTWADEFNPAFQHTLVESVKQRQAYYESRGLPWPTADPLNFLAISGGGDYGAYGAGVLFGWTQAGDRPEFDLVTGVSTGSLIAPFAFLGPEYDDQLRKVYTTIDAKKVFILKRIFQIIGGDSIADTKPLAELAAKYIDAKMLKAIAAEHDKGRRLFIATTNLDAQRSMIWDMGRIAKAGRLDLFREVLLASSSIPAVFPPQYIEVKAAGHKYDEMHVDGGVVTQVFLYGPFIDPTSAAAAQGANFHDRKKNMYIIMNNKVAGTYDPVKRKLADIAGTAVSSLIRNQGIGALDRLYLLANRDGFDYNLTFIPDSFVPATTKIFDPGVMNTLFDLGRERSLAGAAWQDHPPGFTP